MSLVQDVRDLLGRPGSSRSIRVQEPVSGLSAELAAVPEEEPLDLELTVASVSDGLAVSGRIRAAILMTCARCLRPTTSTLSLEVDELFSPAAAARGEEYPVRDGFIDLEPMIRDAVLLAVPFAPLCSPECRGLCERCGGDRNVGECVCADDANLSFAPLSGLIMSD